MNIMPPPKNTHYTVYLLYGISAIYVYLRYICYLLGLQIA